ncbi:hypothetical protein Tco_0515245 [Tanacetum coccineum]
MFIKYYTSLIPPKKRRDKRSQGKKIADTPEATIDVSEELDSKPARKCSASRRVVKKKVSISTDENIIPEPEFSLELGKSISLTKAIEEEATRQVHATHAKIVTESVPEPARRRPSGIAFRDISSVTKKLSLDPSQKLKGVQTLTPEEQLDAGTMQALKERVPDESTVVPATSSEETKKSEYTEEDDDDDEKIEWVNNDEEKEKNDDDDDKSIDLETIDDEETDDEFVHSEENVQDDDEETDDELVHANEQVNDNKDEEMTNAEDADTGNGDEEIFDTIKVDAEKTEEVKDDIKKAELPPTSSNLYLKEADNTTTLRASLRSGIPPTVNAYLESNLRDALQKVLQKHMKELIKKYPRQVDYKEMIEESVQANIINEVKNQLPKFLPKAVSDFATLMLEITIKKAL